MTDDVAAFLGVSGSTVRAYITRHQMPEPDRMFGRSPGWRPQTIETWHAGRPRKSRKGIPVDR
jgi:predicted DNA-binding transcriptional regulator AlpA